MATVRALMAAVDRVIFDALKKPLLRYALGLVIFSLALGVRLAIFPLDAGYPFFTFYPAVVLTALACGTGPALAGIVLSSIVSDYLLIPPAWSISLTFPSLAAIAIYATSSVFICLMIRKSRQGIVERSLLTAVVRSTDIAIMSKTMEGVITCWNPEAERIFGYSAAEALGKQITMLFPPDRIQEEVELLARSSRGETIAGYETVRLRKDGSPLEVSVTQSPIRDRFGRVTGVSIIDHDITRQRASEESLRLSNRNLTEAVAELKRSNKELDDFAFIASHDLKEPLRGIHNYVSFLQEDYANRLDVEGRSMLDRIQRLAERMTALTDSLLTLSRLGSTPLPMESVDLEEVLNGVAEDIKPVLGSLNVELRRGGRLPVVTGNLLRIQEVFQNLIVNAAKYNDKPEKWVEVGCKQTGAAPVIYVRDNGIGIPPHHRDVVFRIFKRLHDQNKFGGGAGAGLTIVKKIIERHDGRIWLESEEGAGTTFYFTLAKGL